MSRTSTSPFHFSLLALLGLASSAWAQGVLIVIDPPEPVPLPRPIIRPVPAPQPAMTYKIKELAVNARLIDQVAKVQVSQAFVNTGSRQMEVSFVFPLPYDGAIDSLTFMVDGTEYEAKLLPAKEARSIYEGYVRRNQDPALLEWMGTGMFKTSVFPVPPGAERTVTMKYTQLLRKDHNLTDFLFPLATAKYTSRPVEKVSISATIESSAEIKNVYSPTHEIEVKRPGNHQATISYEVKDSVPTSDFRLFFDTAPGSLAASVISYRPKIDEDGYFLVLASPEIKAESEARPAKTVVFVVDRSGSMSGKKIQQAKDALKFVVNNLHNGDLFNIVAYDSTVESFKPELQKFEDETRKQALGFIEGLYAGGSTNIEGAIGIALKQLQDEKRPNFIVFLTDGQPTAGETNEGKIVENIRGKNEIRARLINFGVGYDVNSRLLDRLARENYGQSEFVRPNEDIEVQVSRLYSKINSPVLTNVAVNFDAETAVEKGSPVSRIYPRKVFDLFEGEQLVLVGRYKEEGDAKVIVTGTTGEGEQKFDFPAKFVKSSSDQSYAFVEKLWAMRRIGDIIDELDLHGQNEELVSELVALSTKHGILTPYTSFLADDLAQNDLANGRGNEDRARRALERLGEAEGQAAFAQRDEKKQLREANIAPLNSGFELPAEPAELDPAGPPADDFGGIATAKPAAPGVKYRDIDSDKLLVADAVQVVEGETLYRRGKRWIAENAKDVKLEKEEELKKLKTIERFSDAYFKLVAENSTAENAIFAKQQAGQELVIRLRGEVYLVK